MKKYSTYLFWAAGIWLAVDMFYGFQKAQAGTDTSWANGLLQVEAMNPLPIPVWAELAGVGAVLHFV